MSLSIWLRRAKTYLERVAIENQSSYAICAKVIRTSFCLLNFPIKSPRYLGRIWELNSEGCLKEAILAKLFYIFNKVCSFILRLVHHLHYPHSFSSGSSNDVPGQCSVERWYRLITLSDVNSVNSHCVFLLIHAM